MVRSLLTVALLVCPAFAAGDESAIDQALHHLYNFNFQSTHDVLDKYIAAHPEDPLPYGFRASAYLFYELDRLHLLEAEFLTDDEKLVEKKKKLDPDPATRVKFLKALDDATKRAEAILRVNPKDKMALFSLCIAQASLRITWPWSRKSRFRAWDPPSVRTTMRSNC